MSRPKLTFVCQLEPRPLAALFTDTVISRLVSLKATICLGLVDLSTERAAVVRRLNQSGVPVIAWLLLPKEQGYWLNAGNASEVLDRYEHFTTWSAEQNLVWTGVVLDIEPDIRDFSLLGKARGRMMLKSLPRLFSIRKMRRARAAYQALVALIHASGYPVACYQFPLIADERRVGSTVLQRLAGVVDVSVDREIWMLHTSLLRPNGASILASYAPEAQAIGLGLTGGSMMEPGFPMPAHLSWDELARDLRLAWLYCDNLYIFTLEGCVEHGFLDRLGNFDWDLPILTPDAGKARIDAWRSTIQSGLWLAQRLPYILVGVGAGLAIWKGWRYYRHR